jgi:hypothetical protein
MRITHALSVAAGWFLLSGVDRRRAGNSSGLNTLQFCSAIFPRSFPTVV